MQARQYSPTEGRFLGQDVYASAGADLQLQSDPLTQNRYVFAGGNPVSRIEWDGHHSKAICQQVKGADCGGEWPRSGTADGNKREGASGGESAAGGSDGSGGGSAAAPGEPDPVFEGLVIASVTGGPQDRRAAKRFLTKELEFRVCRDGDSRHLDCEFSPTV